LNGTLTGTNTWQAGSGNLVGANVIKAGLTWVAGSWNGAVVTAASNTLVSIRVASTMIWPIAPSTTRHRRVERRPHTRRRHPRHADLQQRSLGFARDLTLNNDFQGNGTVFNTMARSANPPAAGANTTISGVTFNQLAAHWIHRPATSSFRAAGNFTGGAATNLVGFVYLNGGAFNINGTVTSTNVQLAGATLTGNKRNQRRIQLDCWRLERLFRDHRANTILEITSGSDHEYGELPRDQQRHRRVDGGRIRGGGGSPGTFSLKQRRVGCANDQVFNNDSGGNGTVFNYGTLRNREAAPATYAAAAPRDGAVVGHEAIRHIVIAPLVISKIVLAAMVSEEPFSRQQSS